MRNGLKVDDLLRAEGAGEEIAEGGEVSAKSSQPVDVCFRRQTTHQVFQAWADDELEDAGPGEGSLSRKIDRIGHLHVSHAQSCTASDLGAEVDSAGIRDVHKRSEGRDLPGEIPVLVPSVQGQGLVEAEIMLADSRQTETHIAAIGEEGRGDLLLGLGVVSAGYD